MTLIAAAGSFYYIESGVIRQPAMWFLSGSGWTPSVGQFNSNTSPGAGWVPFAIPVAVQHAEMNLGFALNSMGAFSADGDYDIAGLSVDGGTTFALTLAIYKSGSQYGLKVKRGLTVIADTGLGVIDTSTRYFIEWHTVLGTASNGSTHIDVNEVVRANASAVTTAPSGTVWNSVGFHSPGSTASWSVDDMYLTNGAGSFPLNGLLGDVEVALIGPSADTATRQWTASADTVNHWKNLHYDQFDSRNINDGTEGNREIFDTQAAPPEPGTFFADASPAETYVAGKTVYAVIAEARAKASALPRKMSYGLRVGTDEVLTEVQLTTGFLNYYTVYGLAPDGGTWTTTKLDALQVVVQTGANT